MRRSLAIALVLTLLASLAGNGFLYAQLRGYYAELQATRLNPLGLDFHGDDVPARDGRTRLVLLGDSRVEDWRPGPAFDDLQVVPRGLDTQTSAQVLQRLPHHVLPLDPDVVVLQVGINDLKAIPLFPELRDEIVGDLRAHIEHIVTSITSFGGRVVLTTIAPVGAIPLARRPFWSDDVQRAVDEVNAWLRGLAGPDVAVLDAFALLADDDGRAREGFSRDALHLTDAAYTALDAALDALLRRRQWR